METPIAAAVTRLCQELYKRSEHLDEEARFTDDHALRMAHYMAARAVRDVAEGIHFALNGTDLIPGEVPSDE